MATPSRPRGIRGTGEQTRVDAQRIALELFTTRGYEATSLREIAERLGVSKAALYYHFASKDDLLRSLMGARGSEVEALLEWVRGELADTAAPAGDLAERAVLRWVDTVSVDKLRGIRFLLANPTLLRGEGSRTIGDGLETIATLVAGPSPDPTRLLLIRMAFLSINAAVAAARGTALSDEQIVAGARESALALLVRARELPDS